MLIREFQEGDELSLWNVFYSAVHVTTAADYSPEQIELWATTVNPDMAKWTNRMRGIRPFVAESDGEIVGYADVQPNGYIDHVFVSPTVARRGVGSALMRRILETARDRGMSVLTSNVSVTAQPFFYYWGFEIQSMNPACICGITFRNFQMRKRIDSAREK
ncbi:GNAT family N-acetyltransferase [soil metagenome]